MRCVVVGYGSIGKRHAMLLKNLGCDVALVTQQTIADFPSFTSVADALAAQTVDYVVIANATHLHYPTLLALIAQDYRGVVLVEKPLYAQLEQLPDNQIAQIVVAYHMRFHDLLIDTKKLLQDDKLITYSAYVGQYLPTWRKEGDYRDCYSAKKEWGGGVLRDLSHELDYSLWLCGPCEEVTAVGGHFSPLEITSDDAYSILMKCTDCPMVNVHMNYLDRTTRRKVVINTERHTIILDFVKGFMSVDDEIKAYPVVRDAAYIKQHKAILNQQYADFCHYTEGHNIVKLIDTIEQAAITKTWMTLESALYDLRTWRLSRREK